MKCKSGAVREAQLVLREMEREGLPPSPHDLALATTTFAWNKRGELAATWRGKTLAALDRAADTCPVAMRDASLELLLQSCKVGHDMPAARSTQTPHTRRPPPRCVRPRVDCSNALRDRIATLTGTRAHVSWPRTRGESDCVCWTVT